MGDAALVTASASAPRDAPPVVRAGGNSQPGFETLTWKNAGMFCSMKVEPPAFSD